MLTLRQIEVIRAIMVAGTVKGAAELLNVSAPGISRVMKYTEDQLGIRLFSRIHGRYSPTEEARDIFEQGGLGLSVGRESASGNRGPQAGREPAGFLRCGAFYCPSCVAQRREGIA